MVAATDPIEPTEKASTLRHIVLGALVLWAPYVFVWFVLGAKFHRAYRWTAIGWTIVWCVALALVTVGQVFDHARIQAPRHEAAP